MQLHPIADGDHTVQAVDDVSKNLPISTNLQFTVTNPVPAITNSFTLVTNNGTVQIYPNLTTTTTTLTSFGASNLLGCKWFRVISLNYQGATNPVAVKRYRFSMRTPYN